MNQSYINIFAAHLCVIQNHITMQSSLVHHMILTYFMSWEGKWNAWDSQCTRHAMTTANCYLHSLHINLSVNVLWARWTVAFPARSTRTSWKEPNTIYTSLELYHIRGIPSFNLTMHIVHKDLVSAGHVSILHPEILGVILGLHVTSSLS